MFEIELKDGMVEVFGQVTYCQLKGNILKIEMLNEAGAYFELSEIVHLNTPIQSINERFLAYKEGERE